MQRKPVPNNKFNVLSSFLSHSVRQLLRVKIIPINLLVQALHPPQDFQNPTITTFKSPVKENNDSNKTCTYVHFISFHQSSFV
jgi:hypothetical protein